MPERAIVKNVSELAVRARALDRRVAKTAARPFDRLADAAVANRATRKNVFGALCADVVVYGAAVAAFQRNTTDAVVVLSVFLKPGTGSFAYRSR